MKPIKRLLALSAILLAVVPNAFAKLEYSVSGEGGAYILVVSGVFEADDDLSKFDEAVSRHNPFAVAFDSPGGSIIKAMELGEKIRKHRLMTIQGNKRQCTSACAFAFLGGEERAATSGAIGVHQIMFTSNYDGDTARAASDAQMIVAVAIGYLEDMGINPRFLQLALSTENKGMSFLTEEDMAMLGVTTIPVRQRGAEVGKFHPGPTGLKAEPENPAAPATKPIRAPIPTPRPEI